MSVADTAGKDDMAQAADAARPQATMAGGGSQLSTAAMSLVLVMVTGVQALSTYAALSLPTVATKAAPTFGVGPEVAGYQVSVIYVGAALVSSVAGLCVRRWGAARTSAVAMLFSAIGLAIIAAGTMAAGILGSLVVGSAYGLTNPAASHLLFKYAPRNRQNLIFAMKQTGVPLGGMLAAMLLPRLSVPLGWQEAMLLTMALPLSFAALCLIVGRRLDLDSDRNPKAVITQGPVAGLRTVLANPRIRALTIMGVTYAVLQLCLMTFLVTMLVTEFGWTLVAAGTMATAMQIGGAIGRVAWSVLADVLGQTRRVLLAIGILSAICAGVVATASPAWPVALLALLLVTFGFSIIGWNGLWMAEIARSAKPGEVGLATGGVLVFTYVGIVGGPAAFTTVYKLIGSYGVTFALFSAFTIVGAAALLTSRDQPETTISRTTKP